MDGSGFFLLSAAEQIEKYEEWVEVPVEKPKEEEKKEEAPKSDEKGEPMETDKTDNAEKMDTSQNSEEGKTEEKGIYFKFVTNMFAIHSFSIILREDQNFCDSPSCIYYFVHTCL